MQAIYLGGLIAGFGIPCFLIAIAAKWLLIKLHLTGVDWANLTPARALKSTAAETGAAKRLLAYIYALSQWCGAAFMVVGLVLFLFGYL